VEDDHTMRFKHKRTIQLQKLPRKNVNGKRYYEAPNGQLLHSVTRVVGIVEKEAIDAWRKKVGEGYADAVSFRATSLGTKMHKVIESYLNNEKIEEENIIALAHFNNIKEFIDKIDNIYKTEGVLFSESLGLAGTFDCVGDYDGKISMIDFKTASKQKKPEWIEKYYLQETAYALMWNDLTHIDIDQIVTIISGEDGSRDVFIESKDKYINRLLEIIKQYNEGIN